MSKTSTKMLPIIPADDLKLPLDDASTAVTLSRAGGFTASPSRPGHAGKSELISSKRKIPQKSFFVPASYSHQTGKYAVKSISGKVWHPRMAPGPKLVRVINQPTAAESLARQQASNGPRAERSFSISSSTCNGSDYKTGIITSSFAHAISTSDYMGFEDGMENNISRGISRLVSCYGNDAVRVIASFVPKKTIHALVASEIITWLSKIRHDESRDLRLIALHDALFHPHPYVRDAAMMGLYNLNDPSSSAHAVRIALHFEQEASLLGSLKRLEKSLITH